MRLMFKAKAFILLLLLLSSTAQAAEPTPSVRKQFWTFELSAFRHDLKAGDGNELKGKNLNLSIGKGSMKEKWFSYGSVDIILGPYEPVRGNQLDVDYKGVGLSYWIGYSAPDLNLRDELGGYGFIVGLIYSDLVGESIGKNLKINSDDTNPDNVNLIDQYRMHINYFAISPTIFFSWLKPGRKLGDNPDLLKTRIEGYFLTLGLAIPIVSNYQAKYSVKERIDESGRGEIVSADKSDSGSLEGLSIMIRFTTLFGI